MAAVYNRMFAEQLNELFARTRWRTTNRMVAQALTERGYSISAPYLSQLRNGVRTRPADRYVRAIAQYFNVSLSHFYEAPFESGSANNFRKDIELVDTIYDDGLRRLLLNAHGLSTASMDILVGFADRLCVPIEPVPAT